jgi:hypothetical protein
MQRHRKQQRAARREYPSQLAQGADVIFDVLDDVHRADQIERPIRERQIDDGSDVGTRTGLAQAGDRSFARVDKSSSRQRQPGTQTGSARSSDSTSGHVLNRSAAISCASPHSGS